MARIAFILLCHKDPEGIIETAERLTAGGDCIAIHFDGNAKPEAYTQLRNTLDANPNVTFATKREKCGWGEWSLVQATLNAVEAAVEAFPKATHFYMLSGDCQPVKSAKYCHTFLDGEDCDYIESFDYFDSDWIKTGMKEDRLIYRHWFNERTQKQKFYASYNLQKRFGITRKIPDDLQIMIGSQWWCLRRDTINKVLAFCRERPEVLRFFSTTWIPDETFFQTLVNHVVPRRELRLRTLTFLVFSDYGLPAVFYDDHYDFLVAQGYLFARKISPHAHELKARLGALYLSDTEDFEIQADGRTLYKFLTNEGRNGRRFAPRFWETESTLGRERELKVVACKKWHVAKRLLDGVRPHTDIPLVEYIFDEDGCPLPDLGGIEATKDKRARHRRALLRMLFDYYKSDRMTICVDTSQLHLLKDLAGDKARLSVLLVDTSLSDDYLVGHAERAGLAGAGTPFETLERMLPTLRRNVQSEADDIRDAGFRNMYRIREGASASDNARALAQFFDIPADRAEEVARIGHLYVD